MKRYFITGTDTDCGKTYVTKQLLQYLLMHYKKAVAVKPIGCGGRDHEICPWEFKLPASPHIAAAHEGKAISAAMLSDFCYEEEYADNEYMLIEGAGGLMVPLNASETWLDFLTLSKIPVILVVGMRLGCLNHALLTAAALQNYDITCSGWIANCLDNNMLALEDNIKTLQDKMHMPLLATVPFKGSVKGKTASFLLL